MVKKEQMEFFSACLQEAPIRFTLRIGHMDHRQGICCLNILRGKNVFKIDSKSPAVDLRQFPLHGQLMGPHTEPQLRVLKKEALELWLGGSEFLLSDVDTMRFPNIRFSLRPVHDDIPAGVNLRAFIETSAAEILKGTLGYEGYIAIGRPISTRNLYYFKRA